jgi:putative tricarboxylic transport membrane protein
MTDANPWLFLTRPISGLLLLAAAGSIALVVWQHWRHQDRVAEEAPDF